MRLHQIAIGLKAYSEKKVWRIALVGTIIILIGILLFDDRKFISTVLNSSFIDQPFKLIVQSIIGRISIDPLSFTLSLITASLAGMLIAAYYKAFNLRVQSTKAGFAGGFGALLGIFGLGCATCGPTVLVSILALVTGQSIAVLIAKNTVFIYIFSVAILLLALCIMLNQIGKAYVCNIEE